jgi:catechol 2,3-dioxygenase-like lactoylglutathione lyase family enzyme
VIVADLRIEIFPDDLDITVDFYTRVLGFQLVRDERTQLSPYVSLTLGRVRLGAARRPRVDPSMRRPPVGVELVIEVEDLDDAMARVQAAEWPVDEELTTQPWGLRDFRLLDPSGYYWRVTDYEP